MVIVIRLLSGQFNVRQSWRLTRFSPRRLSSGFGTDFASTLATCKLQREAHSSAGAATRAPGHQRSLTVLSRGELNVQRPNSTASAYNLSNARVTAKILRYLNSFYVCHSGEGAVVFKATPHPSCKSGLQRENWGRGKVLFWNYCRL